MPTTTITGTVLETADPGSPTLGAGKVVALPQDRSGNPLPKESRLAPISATIAAGSVSLSLPDAPSSVRWLIMVSPAAGTLRPYALASVAPGGTVTTATLRSSRKGGAMLPDAASVEALLASLPVDDARGGSLDIEALTETLSDSFAGVDDDLSLFVVRDGETIPVSGGGGGGGFDPDEDIVLSAGKGLVLTSPDGTKTARFFLDNDGDFAREDVGGGGPDPVEGIDPMDVESLSWYLDAQSISDKSNGDPMTTASPWVDRGPNGWNGKADFVNPALYATSGINGLPSVRYVRANELQTNGQANVSGQERTFVLVMQVANFATTTTVLLFGAIALRVLTDGRLNISRPGVADIGTSTDPIVAGTPYVVTFSIGSAGWSIHVNGVAQGSGVNAETVPTGSTDFNLGTATLEGFIGAVVRFGEVLDAETREGVENYLIDRWGIA